MSDDTVFALIRSGLERELSAAENPRGMSTHDGRVRVPADHVRRVLRMIDELEKRLTHEKQACNHWFGEANRDHNELERQQDFVCKLTGVGDVQRAFAELEKAILAADDIHSAFYKLTVGQRDRAWAEIEQLRRERDQWECKANELQAEVQRLAAIVNDIERDEQLRNSR